MTISTRPDAFSDYPIEGSGEKIQKKRKGDNLPVDNVAKKSFQRIHKRAEGKENLEEIYEERVNQPTTDVTAKLPNITHEANPIFRLVGSLHHPKVKKAIKVPDPPPESFVEETNEFTRVQAQEQTADSERDELLESMRRLSIDEDRVLEPNRDLMPVDQGDWETTLIGLSQEEASVQEQDLDLMQEDIEELSGFIHDLMDVDADEIPKCSTVQEFIDCVMGFSPPSNPHESVAVEEVFWENMPAVTSFLEGLSFFDSRADETATEDSWEADFTLENKLTIRTDHNPIPHALFREQNVERVNRNKKSSLATPQTSQIRFFQPESTLSTGEALQKAKHFMHHQKYDEAILVLTQAYSISTKKNLVLKLLADCFFQSNRLAEALEMYQKVAHSEPKNLKIKEKIADCLTAQHQYLKANLIYAIICRKVNTAHSDLIKAKIKQNNEALKSLQQWPAFDEVMYRVGIANGQKITAKELEFIAKFQKEINPRAYLMWDVEMNKVKNASIESLEKDPDVVKYPIYLPDGSKLKDASGKDIHLYEAPHIPLLTHFTKSTNAALILDAEHNDKRRSPGDFNPNSFWNSQYKICCSMVKPGSKSFYGVNRCPAVGFATYVPDPFWNIIHTWGDDCYTPTYFKAEGIQAATGQGGSEKALAYNEFMIRFQPLTLYVYSMFQQADRLEQQLAIRDEFLRLQEDMQKEFTGISMLDSLFNKLTSFFPSLDPIKGKVEPLINEIEKEIQKSDLGDTATQESLIKKLNGLKKMLINEGESVRSQAVAKRVENLFTDLSKSVAVREGGKTTRPTRYRNESLKKPLLSLYIAETRKLSETLLSSNIPEETLFTSLFRRPPKAGETVSSALDQIDVQLQALYQNNKEILYKRPQSEDLMIWTRTLSPKELLDSVPREKYSEIGLRSHISSDQVNASHARFAGIVLEQGMTVCKSGNGFVIRPIEGSGFLSEDVSPEKIVDIIRKAHTERLPCFVI